jgi:hypothetical protein
MEQNREAVLSERPGQYGSAVTHEQMQGRGKVDPRMDSLALSNVPTWHFNLRIT